MHFIAGSMGTFMEHSVGVMGIWPFRKLGRKGH